MFDVFFNILEVIFEFLKLPLFLIISFICIILFLMFVNLVKMYIKGKRFKKAIYRKNVKRSGFFKKIFVEFPRMLAHDIFESNPDAFTEHGMIIFTGRQGKGKTISLVKYLDDLRLEWGALKIITNLAYTEETDELNHWRQLTEYNNGALGVAVGIDETQNWFSSADSKNFPPEMLDVVTQNRKNRRVIGGTAQCFYSLSKAIRVQTTQVRECHTFFKCITFVFKKEPILDYEGNVVELKNRGMYFYVHTPELRDKYDTYKAIMHLSKSGFVDKEKIYT